MILTWSHIHRNVRSSARHLNTCGLPTWCCSWNVELWRPLSSGRKPRSFSAPIGKQDHHVISLGHCLNEIHGFRMTQTPCTPTEDWMDAVLYLAAAIHRTTAGQMLRASVDNLSSSFVHVSELFRLNCFYSQNCRPLVLNYLRLGSDLRPCDFDLNLGTW